MVARVDKIKRSSIERIGQKEYIKVGQHSLRIIRPEDYLSVSKGEIQKEHLYVIIPKQTQHHLGILVTKIRDTVERQVILNQDDIQGRGLQGSAIIDNKIVLFIDVDELFHMLNEQHEDGLKEGVG